MKRKNITIIISLFAASVLMITALSGCSVGKLAFNSIQRISQGMHSKGNQGFIENKNGSNKYDYKNMPCNPGKNKFENKQNNLNGAIENRPFMGIEMAQSGNGTTGVIVNSVIAGSPAEKAGIKAQDIITAADGKEVKNPQDLLQAVLGHKVGDIIKITINRSGQSQEFSVTLDSISNILPDGLGKGQGQNIPKEQNGLNDSGKSGQSDNNAY